MTLNDPYPQFQGHAILWRWSQKRNDIQTYFHWNIYMDLHTRYSAVSFRMILSDLNDSKIFDDTKRRAISLWQLSVLVL